MAESFSMKNSQFLPGLLCRAAALACLNAGAAWAQSSAPAPAQQLAPVLVTGNPLANTEALQPGHVLAGDALTLRRGASLGESLDGLAGVSATAFGPNASRPVLRGLDGDRVRLLSNAGASIDASALSFDHAVPLDPLVVERIEVLRGPAALLYGGSAIGGVVNTLDNRIPRQRLSGLTGAVEGRLGGAAGERSAALVLDGGAGAITWHADAATRKSDDLRVPAHDFDGERVNRVRNSASDSHGGAIGAAVHFDSGFVGVSLDDFRKDYGVTVEPDVGIRMQRQRAAAAGEWRNPNGPIAQLSWQLSRARYEHVEVEGDGAIGTRFSNRGTDGRIEARHAPLGPLTGLIGLQWEQAEFSALGEEALVPSSRTRSRALFLLEQYKSGPLTLAAGVRRESVKVDADGDAPDAIEQRFGAASSRSFNPGSVSLQAGYALTPTWSVQLSLGHTQRAPAFYELHANGVHIASGAYERGDDTLGLERARSADLGLRWQSGESALRLNLHQTRFANYISLAPTGAQIDVDGESVPEYAFRAVPARLHGLELEGRHAFAQQLGGWQLAMSGQLDVLRGVDRSTGEALPRLAPLRVGLGLEARDGVWQAALDWRWSPRQDRVPALDSATPSYQILRLSLARQFKLAGSDALWYVKLDNVGNQLAYNATTIATLRELSPLPGRSLMTGLQLRF